MKEKKTEEKLPNIYSSLNNNYAQTKQSISRRNEIIDEYILSMDKKEKGISEISLTSEEDDKDPFSSKAIKNLKPIKKDKNKLILPHFDKRKNLKSERTSRNNNLQENKSYTNSNNSNYNHNHNHIAPKNNILSEKELSMHSKISKNKNYSENNIYGNKNVYLGKFLNNNNSNLNSKWTSSNTYKNYVNSANYNLQKNNSKNRLINNKTSNNSSAGKELKGRSRSHIGNKQSYYLYKDKNNFLENNSSSKNMHNKKYIFTQIDHFPKNNKYLKNYKRNYTAKILKNKKISILENNKQNKKTGKNRVYSTLHTRKIVENKHQIYEKLINEKNNPYGLGWINKMFGKNSEEKVGLTKGFVNGVPVVKILSKGELSKREIKKRLSEIEKKKKEEEDNINNKYNNIVNADAKLNERDLNDEYNIPKEILEQFNKNTKNFFKLRKDIIEAPEEEEGQTIEK